MVPFVVAMASLVLVYFAFVAYTTLVAAAAPPSTLNFQGRLTNASGIIMPDGLYNMQFRIFTTPTGGTASWSETREVASRVQVTNGLFSTQLGQVTPLPASLFNTTDLYFEITMASPATATCSTASCATWESPMGPRQKLATSAYAFNAAMLNGKTEADFAAASGSGNYIQNQNVSVQSTSSFWLSGGGRSNTSFTAPLFTSAAATSLTLDSGTTGALSIGTGANAKTITIGNTTGATALALSAGTGGVTINSSTPVAGGAVVTINSNITVSSANGYGLANYGNLAVGPGSTLSSYYNTGSQLTFSDTGTAYGGLIGGNMSEVLWSGASNSAEWVIGNGGKVSNVSGAGTINRAVGTYGIIQGSAGSTINNAYAVTASVYGSNITNAYGIYVQPITAGTVSNYPLYLDSNPLGGGPALMSVSSTGATSIRGTTNQSNAFIVQGAGGSGLLGVNTKLSGNSISNPSVEVDTAGWVQRAGTVISRTTAEAYYGQASVSAVTTATANNGINYPIVLPANSFYWFSAMVKTSSAANIRLGYAADGVSETLSCSPDTPTSAATWTLVQCSLTTPATVSGSAYVYLYQTDAVARTIYIDGLRAGWLIKNYQDNQITLGNSATTVQIGGVDSDATRVAEAALRVRQSNKTNVGVQITAGYGMAAGSSAAAAFMLEDSSGNSIIRSVNDGNGAYTTITGGETLGWQNAALVVTTANAGASAFRVQGTSGQTADIMQVKDVFAGTNLFGVGATGQTIIRNTTDSTTSFRVLNAAGANVLTTDTTNSRVVIGTGPLGNSTGYTLVLDSKNTAGDPAGVNGAMYYNSSTGTFRCYQAGTWQNCIGGALYTTVADSTTVNGSVTTVQDLSTSYSMPANYCTAGRVIHLYASGITTSTTTAQPIRFSVRIGGTAVTSQANNYTPAASMANLGWVADASFTCRAAPSAASVVMASGSVIGQTSTTATVAGTANPMGPASATGVNIATNAAQTVTLAVQFSGTASAANTLTLKQLYVNAE